jgi:hypothetical protein
MARLTESARRSASLSLDRCCVKIRSARTSTMRCALRTELSPSRRQRPAPATPHPHHRPALRSARRAAFAHGLQSCARRPPKECRACYGYADARPRRTGGLWLGHSVPDVRVHPLRVGRVLDDVRRGHEGAEARRSPWPGAVSGVPAPGRRPCGQTWALRSYGVSHAWTIWAGWRPTRR